MMRKDMVDSNELVRIIKEELNERGSIVIKIHGESMIPTFCDGDIVKITKAKSINVGDIICYWLYDENNKSIIIAHRVIFVRKNYVLTKGDNNKFIDPVKVLTSKIIGKIEII